MRCFGVLGLVVTPAVVLGGQGLCYGEVLMVDPLVPGAYHDLNSAIAAAADGDTLLIRPGVFAGFVLQGKGLQMVAETTDSVIVNSGSTVSGLAANQEFSAVGIQFRGEPGPLATGLLLEGCLGAIHLQGCQFSGAHTPYDPLNPDPPAGGSGLKAVDCHAVTLVDCVLYGGSHREAFNPEFTLNVGLPAAWFLGATRVAVWDSEFHGGDGWGVWYGQNPGSPGGDGVVLGGPSFFAFFANCLIVGGRGGDAGTLDFAGNGGIGMRTGSVNPTQLLNVVVLGGEGGTSASGIPQFQGVDGVAVFGPHVFLNKPRQGVDGVDFALEGADLFLEVSGPVGAPMLLQCLPKWPFFWDVQPAVGGGLIPYSEAPYTFPFPMSLARVGSLGASGTASSTLRLPALNGSQAANNLWVTAVLPGSPADWKYSTPHKVVVIDCQQAGPDCDGDGQWDYCQILNGTGGDCDNDLVLDACQSDCNGNGRSDACDLAFGTSLDANADGTPDECQAAGTIWHVDPSAAPGGDGSALAPFQTIQAGLLAANGFGDILELADGVYTGAGNWDLNIVGSISIRSQNGPTLCVLDLQGQHWAMRFGTGTYRLQGVSFVNGFSNVAGTGGAVTCVGRTLIEDCVFENNRSLTSGGAVFGRLAMTMLRGCQFVGNRAESAADGRGGAVFQAQAVLDCTFDGNYAAVSGGALDTVKTVLQSRFFGNEASVSGGSIANPSGPILQSLFAGSRSGIGGAIYKSGNAGQEVDMELCTLVENTANVRGGAIYATNAGTLRVRNCILASNHSPAGPDISGNGSQSRFDFRFSTLAGGGDAIQLTQGSTISAIDFVFTIGPVFLDSDGPDNLISTWADNDYRLATGAPQVDGGDNRGLLRDDFDLDRNGVVLEDIRVDLMGNPRRTDDPLAPNLGYGVLPVVNQGALE